MLGIWMHPSQGKRCDCVNWTFKEIPKRMKFNQYPSTANSLGDQGSFKGHEINSTNWYMMGALVLFISVLYSCHTLKLSSITLIDMHLQAWSTFNSIPKAMPPCYSIACQPLDMNVLVVFCHISLSQMITSYSWLLGQIFMREELKGFVTFFEHIWGAVLPLSQGLLISC